MPPPPLTDEEVQRIVQTCWDADRVDDADEALGISYWSPKSRWLKPDSAPEIYRREWAKAFTYGLAENAFQSVLKEFDAPPNPDTRISSVLSREDRPRIYRAHDRMCDPDVVYSWDITHPVYDRRPRWLFLPFIASVVCLLLALLTSDPRWAIGLPVGCVIGFVAIYLCQRYVKALPDWCISPTLTFRDLAECVQQKAQVRGEEMLQAAQQYQQEK
jgi:hypothetical protein